MKTTDALYSFFTSSKGLPAVVEILLIYIGIYYFIRFCEGTRGAGILKGLAVIITIAAVLLYWGAEAFSLNRLQRLTAWFATASTTALIILLQPELRRGLARLSQSPMFWDLLKDEFETVDELIRACFRLAKNRVGALIAIERETTLQPYIDRGTALDADLRSELLNTIFYPGTELHDGAVVVRRGRIAAAGSLFPLSENPRLGTWAGTRHRAAVGLTEETDAIVVVVSEERGEVALCVRGDIHRDLKRDEFEKLLRRFYAQKDETEPPTEEGAEATEVKGAQV